jgi:prophage tail gpP-like protein
MDEIYFSIRGENYKDIISANITKDIDAVAGGFAVSVTYEMFLTLRVKVDDSILLYMNDSNLMTGYITEIELNQNPTERDVTILGNCKTVDLVDSSIFNNCSYTVSKLKRLCELAISFNGLDIDVLDERDKFSDNEFGDFAEGTILNGEAGESLLNFLNRYASISSAMLTSNELGQLIIYDNHGVDVGAKIIVDDQNSNERLISSNVIRNNSNRFSKIIIKSQGESLDDDGDDIIGEAIDGEVSRKRTKMIISDSILDIDSATKLAKWEVNKRRSDSVSYNCALLGFRTNGIYGDFWRVGMLVSVNDIYSEIKSMMLVKSVSFDYSMEGRITNLELVASDSYTLKTEASQFAKGV